MITEHRTQNTEHRTQNTDTDHRSQITATSGQGGFRPKLLGQPTEGKGQFLRSGLASSLTLSTGNAASEAVAAATVRRPRSFQAKSISR